MNANNELLRAAKDAVYQGLADDDGLLEGEPLRARLINLRAAIAAAESAPHPDLLRAAKALLRYAERNECSHEETHRGGAIWTICDDCGRKWADDEGGFKPYQEPKEIAEARAAIAAAEQAPIAADGTPSTARLVELQDRAMGQAGIAEMDPVEQQQLIGEVLVLRGRVAAMVTKLAALEKANVEWAARAAAEQAQPSEPAHVTCNDPFAFRCGERIHLRTSGVDRDDRLAFMCAPVPPLLDPACKQSFRGPPVENYCVVGAELVNGKWQWLRIAPDTKELIGDLLFDHGLERGKWYGAIITSGGAS